MPGDGPTDDAAVTTHPSSLSLETYAEFLDGPTQPDPNRTLLDHEHGFAQTSLKPHELPRLPGRAEHGTDPAVLDLKMGRLLGEGAMGIVHDASQRSLDRDVAVKTVRPGRVGRFETALVAEARILGRLAHPNIPPVHALYDGPNGPVLVMKKVEGVTWRALLKDDDHEAWAQTAWAEDPPLTRHLEVLDKVCDAIRFAHTRGIVHRDIKPDNVMIGAFGEVYVLDWGVAARIEDLKRRRSSIVGTPAYFAPEMTRGRADARSDIFTLGAVLHRILTGARRHRGEDVDDTILAAMKCLPYDYDATLPADLVALAVAATAKDPDDRPQTVTAFQQHLRAHLRHKDARALSDLAEERFRAAQDEDDDARKAAMLSDARFALEDAMRRWPGHPTAANTLADVIEQGARLALARGDVNTADAWLADASAVSDELRDRLAELRAQADHQRQLQAAAAEMDPERGRVPRTIFVGGCAVAMIGVAGAVGRATDNYAFAVWASGNAAVFTMTAIALARKHLLGTAFNRHITFFVLLASTGVFVNRVLSSARGTSLNDALATDLLLMAALAGAAAITLDMFMAVLAGIAAIAAALASYFPEHTPAIVPGTAALGGVVVALRWWWLRRA